MAPTTYSLPALPYAYDALEPHISKEIMTLHHTKHHQTYVNSLNAALVTQATLQTTGDIAGQVSLQQTIKFHAGGHINHSIFWTILAPPSSSSTNPTSAPKLTAAIEKSFGSISAFQEKFNATALGIQGSGWAWLVTDNDGKSLDIVTSKDQDLAAEGKKTAVFGLDMWEHAYYLQYFNNKAEYVKGWWNIVNWEAAEKRFLGKVGNNKI